jgi:hypothetical protein
MNWSMLFGSYLGRKMVDTKMKKRRLPNGTASTIARESGANNYLKNLFHVSRISFSCEGSDHKEATHGGQ